MRLPYPCPNPWFGETHEPDDWPYLARWEGLTDEQWEEIEQWSLEHIQRPHSTYYSRLANVFFFVCLDYSDLLMLQLRFSDID